MKIVTTYNHKKYRYKKAFTVVDNYDEHKNFVHTYLYSKAIRGKQETIHNTEEWIEKVLMKRIKMLAEIGANAYTFCTEMLNNGFDSTVSKDFQFDFDVFQIYIIHYLGYNIDIVKGSDNLIYITILWNE